MASGEGACIGFAVIGRTAQCFVFRLSASMHVRLVLNEPGVSNAQRVLLNRYRDGMDGDMTSRKSEVRTKCERRIFGVIGAMPIIAGAMALDEEIRA
ncbi:hypothetical protein [Cupriavidus sp. D39]|uniref:hypothetical protein n=1 Tax=Cupriavidus sp. D39 TaxID=2997877 RepID=UPI00226FB2A5|nr:hypothetical protein [Cupriavidus sp. D39]MCY0857034.1 hypothetical protein [Cupriavidus sp. D39]